MNGNSAKPQNPPDTDHTPEDQNQPSPQGESQLALILSAKRSKKRLKLIRLSLLGVGALLLALGLVIGVRRISSDKQQTAETPVVSILPVKTLPVEPVKSHQVSRTYTGEVAALRASELGFERSGKLVLFNVDEGDRVATGTPLAKLDASSLETQRLQLLAQKAQGMAVLEELQAGPRNEKIAAARASVRQIKEQLELERTKRSRREYLYAQGAISKEQLDEVAYGANTLEARLSEAQSNLDELLAGTRKEEIEAQKAVVRQSEARLADIEISLAKSTIEAPFSGIISARRLDEGTVVSAGQPVVRLVKDGRPEVRIGIPVSAAAKLALGSKQRVQVGQKTYEAKVSSILPEVDPTTRTQLVVLTLEPSAGLEVASGQTARLEIAETIPTEGYWLPTEALVRGVRGLWSCYVLVETQTEASPSQQKPFRVEQRAVEILHQESDRVLVRGTIQPGAQVITSGTHRLVPGQLVRPANL